MKIELKFWGLLTLLSMSQSMFAQTYDLHNSINFGDVNDGRNVPDGITWYKPAPLLYGIYRTSGAFLSPNYQQLQFAFQTGIIIDGGTQYGRSGTVLQPNGGNVGIGTTTPSQLLELNKTTGSLSLCIKRGSNNIASIGSGTMSEQAFGILQLFHNNNTENVRFQASGDSWLSGGNVGIGTTSPAYTLDVVGTIGVKTIIGPTDQNLVIAGYDDRHGNGQGLVFNAIKNGIRFQTYNGNWNTRLLVHTDGIDVNGIIHTKEVKVDLIGWSDFVFKTTYKLKSLNELESFINQNGHLPEIPTESEVQTNGVNLGEMQMKLLQKMEEMTLYIIEQNKKIETLEQKIQEMENK